MYVNNEKYKRKIKGEISFIIASNTYIYIYIYIYLGITLVMEVKDLNTDDSKTLPK